MMDKSRTGKLNKRFQWKRYFVTKYFPNGTTLTQGTTREASIKSYYNFLLQETGSSLKFDVIKARRILSGVEYPSYFFKHIFIKMFKDRKKKLGQNTRTSDA